MKHSQASFSVGNTGVCRLDSGQFWSFKIAAWMDSLHHIFEMEASLNHFMIDFNS
jgi:hypothetical protein